MITVEEARTILLDSVRLTPDAMVGLFQAAGRRVAGAVSAPHDHPLFDMSAVDGYAFAHKGAGTTWRVVSELAAGDRHSGSLQPGECARIFTGAMLPAGAEYVVMQEHVQRHDGHAAPVDRLVRPGDNVRRKGEQLRAGDRLLEAGSSLGPVEMGLLASAGVQEVRVHAKPAVAIVRTGGEFTDPAAPEPGRIFSSNDAMLAAALHDIGISTEGRIFMPTDSREDLLRDLARAMEGTDVVITTGGVSVGDHDLVRDCLEELGAVVRFHGVEQKPGKPMLFASCGSTAVFGLPGNPRAVIVAWFEYVLPFLHAIQGASPPWLPRDVLPIATPVTMKGVRAEFRAARVGHGSVHVLPDQGSHMLSTLIAANALAYFPSTIRHWEAGDPVEVHYLPGR